MKLRLGRSLLGNARFGLVVGLALASGVGCSDDDSVPLIPAPDAGGTESTATGGESSTGGGGGNTTEEPTTSDTSAQETLTVNPDTSTTSPTGETSMLTETSGPVTSDVMTSSPTSDVDTITSDLTLPTSEPMSTTDVWTSADTSGEALPNLVANGDFEAGTDGWNSWSGTLTASTTKARSGLQSAFHSGGDATGPVSTQVTPIVAGGTYQVTFWASVGSGTAQVRLTRYLACASNQYLWVVNNTPVSSTGWTELTGTFTVPEDCNSTSVQVYAEGDASGVELYIDDVSVVLLSGPDTGSTDTTSDTGATSADVDSGVVDTTTPPDETTEMMPDGGVDASSTEPDTTDVITDPDASVTTDVVTTDVMTSDVATTEEPEPYGPNLLVNSTFEDGDWWWYQAGSGSIAQSSVYAHTGTSSLLSSGRVDTWNGAGLNLLAGGMTSPLEQATTYRIEGWVRIAGTASATVVLGGTVTCDGNTTYPWLANGTVTDSAWVQLAGNFTTPTCPGSGMTAYALTVNNAATGVDIYVDDVSIREVLIP